MKNYGKILKELREDKGISLSSLAKSAQLSKSTLSRFENGETQIGIDKFIKALQTLEVGVTINEVSILDSKVKAGTSNTDLEQLTLLESYRDNEDIMRIFSFQKQQSCDRIESNVLKILAKLFISNLGLNMRLPQDEINLVVTYLNGVTQYNDFYFKVICYFQDILPEDVILNKISNMTKEQLPYSKSLVNLLIKQVIITLEKDSVDKAIVFADLANKVSQ
ncbi:helix-turn-helix domain-containing protein [Streptococcus agalactiae]|uniref:helix-turn-helix domain-containing protein n=1 Tax=Streptococcus agalactiae TaxID=1311 RepID=UPI000332D862|nr:helix-turn-helix transcriptional regulator [Streptococcus agalactiae]CCW41090.1 Transcriptional regulator, Cro/CI family [Streptococcus agalactiae ILRI005]